MQIEERTLLNSEFAIQTEANDGVKKVTREIGPYAVTVLLTIDNQFLGIQDIAKSQSFLDYKQRATLASAHDVERFFEDIPENK